MIESERPISQQEAAIVNWMLRYPAPSGRLLHLAKCVLDLRVVERCDCGCPTITFEKSEEVHPIAEALGKTPGGSVGLILWGRDDMICGLEVYSMEDTTHCTLPTTDSLLPWPTAEPPYKITAPMRCLSLQIQPDNVPQLDVAAVVKELTELTTDPNHPPNVDVQEGNDKGRYVNVSWPTRDHATLWTTLQKKLKQDQQLSQCSIVCCEGQRGWHDYLLLHHYDPSQQLDELPPEEK